MRTLAWGAVGLAALTTGAWIWLTAPYITLELVRIDESPVEVAAIFSNETSDALCTKLYAPADGRLSDEPIFARVARDMPDPNDDLALRDGDSLTLRGFRHELRERNKITGEEIIRSGGRIDVVSWRGPSGVEHTSGLDPAVSETFPEENYVGCR